MWPDGVHLKLFVGSQSPRPVSLDVVEALRDLEVRCSDRERDGFQITFGVVKGSSMDHDVIASGGFDPPARIVAAIIDGSRTRVIFDGLVTHHQLGAGDRPGEALFTVTGEDLSVAMDLEEKNATYPGQSDSTIVTRLLGAYARYGITPDVTSTPDVPPVTERVPTQQGTDLDLIRHLASKRGFLFYIEPTAVGRSRAYWGPDRRAGAAQAALTVGMGPASNIDSIDVSFDALAGEDPTGLVLPPGSRSATRIGPAQGGGASLASRAASPLRRTILRDTSKMSSGEASALAGARSSAQMDTLYATGELDVVRYGDILFPRRRVGVRGLGMEQDGEYYVKSVTHRIRRNEYRQRFVLVREGKGPRARRVSA